MSCDSSNPPAPVHPSPPLFLVLLQQLRGTKNEALEGVIAENKVMINQCVINVQSAREALRLFFLEAGMSHEHFFEWILQCWHIRREALDVFDQLFSEMCVSFDLKIIQGLKNGFINLWQSGYR